MMQGSTNSHRKSHTHTHKRCRPSRNTSGWRAPRWRARSMRIPRRARTRACLGEGSGGELCGATRCKCLSIQICGVKVPSLDHRRRDQRCKRYGPEQAPEGKQIQRPWKVWKAQHPQSQKRLVDSTPKKWQTCRYSAVLADTTTRAPQTRAHPARPPPLSWNIAAFSISNNSSKMVGTSRHVNLPGFPTKAVGRHVVAAWSTLSRHTDDKSASGRHLVDI